MSSVFKPPKLDMPAPQGPVSSISQLASERPKKRRPTGRSESLLAGVSNALKKRLGE